MSDEDKSTPSTLVSSQASTLPSNASNIDNNQIKIWINEAFWSYAKAVSLILGILTTCGLGAIWLTLKASVENEILQRLPRSAEEIEALLISMEKTQGDLQGLSKQMPVGTILPVAFPVVEADLYSYIPKNWALCDGKTIDEQHPRNYHQDEVHSIYWNKKVPNLRGRFLQGVLEGGQVPAEGGTDEISAYTTAKDGAHTHTLPETTGSVSNSGSNPGGHEYFIRDDHDSGFTRGKHLAVDGGSSTQEGQHRHDLGGITKNDSLHSHAIPSRSFVPKNVTVYYLIRIK